MVPDPHAATPPAMMANELPQTPRPRLSPRVLNRGGVGSGKPSTDGLALRTAPAPGRPGTLAGAPHLPKRARFPAHVDRVYERA